jgi:hypothetical protein
VTLRLANGDELVTCDDAARWLGVTKVDFSDCWRPSLKHPQKRVARAH